MSDVDRSHLPIRRPSFSGTARRTLDGSQPDWNLIGHPVPPVGAPNVLLVLIDDAGFGNPSTFGGPIQTPNLTRVAGSGLRYNRFHVTALCSPTRASLLTGRNNHTVGFGSIGNSRVVSRDTRRPYPVTVPPSLGFFETTATARQSSGSGTSRPTRNRVQRVRSTVGRTGGGSTTSTGFSVEDRASGIPAWPRIKRSSAHRRSTTTRTIRSTFPTPWPIGRSSGSTVSAPRTLQSHSSSITPPVAATPHTTSRRCGPTSTRGCSTRAGTSFARKRSLVRSSSE